MQVFNSSSDSSSQLSCSVNITYLDYREHKIKLSFVKMIKVISAEY